MAEGMESIKQEPEFKFIGKIDELHLLKPGSEILDIGCDEGFYARKFARKGYIVDAIDIVDKMEDKKGIHFEKASFVDYVPEKQYDLVFARNVFFQESDPIGQAKRYAQFLKPGGLMCLTFMGEQDDWAREDAIGGQLYAVSRKELEGFQKEFKTIIFQEVKKFEKGLFTEKPKNWHLYKMILQK